MRLRDGDGLALEDGGVVRVRARPEPLLEIHAHDDGELVRIAWHLGNRHLPVQLLGDRIRIRADHVIADMVEGLGGHVEAIEAPFDPEAGAYAPGAGHHHHHDDDMMRARASVRRWPGLSARPLLRGPPPQGAEEPERPPAHAARPRAPGLVPDQGKARSPDPPPDLAVARFSDRRVRLFPRPRMGRRNARHKGRRQPGKLARHVIAHGTGRADTILLRLAHRAANVPAELLDIAALARATAASRERRDEALAQGAAFARAAANWGAPDLPDETPYAVAVGAMAGAHRIDEDTTAAAYLQAFASQPHLRRRPPCPLGQTDRGYACSRRWSRSSSPPPPTESRHARGPGRLRVPVRPRLHAARNPVHKVVPLMTQSPNGPLRVGVGGPVGTGKTALMDALCKHFRARYDIAAITNDIYTKEDAEFLTRAGSLPPERIMGIETGGCPHTAIREDASINLAGVADLRRNSPTWTCS